MVRTRLFDICRYSCLLGLVAFLTTGNPASAQDFDPLLDVKVEQAIAGGEREKALDLLSEAIAGQTDPRILADLYRRLGELQAQAGNHGEAALAYQRQAETIAARKGQLSPELIPAWDAAAREFEAAGQPTEAAEALDAVLNILASAGLLEQAGPYVERLEALAGSADPAAAQRAQDALAAHQEREEAATSRAFSVDPEGGFTTVKIYYATDRKRTGSKDPNEFYSGERGTLELGTATVSIPPRHMPGQIEKPSIWTFTFREDPEKHVVLSSVVPGDPDAVFAEMRDQLGQSGSDEAFVFVHGFNVPFNEAAERTAQMAYDMNFAGVPILFSWPSAGSVLSYIADTAVVNLSGRRLTLFLEDVVRKSGAKRIHLIAHSMGNRAMTDALELYALRHEGEPKAFDQVLFTAPDLDAGLFGEMMKTIRTVAKRVTLYASDRDWALAVSRKLHGDAARAGQGGKTIVHADDVDAIDMSTIGEDMLAHSYYANNPSALTDILSLFWRDAPPAERCGMVATEGTNGNYWSYDPAQCDGDALLSTLSILREQAAMTKDEAHSVLSRAVPVGIDADEKNRLQAAVDRLFGQ
jgi:esterase/lipase superfamily enzyme